ncbi:aminopeptidase N [Burkholderiales bacterium JOSHI_001]|nr:aminopeptidase N [Burkholderiales bacterium JOSHI_001]
MTPRPPWLYALLAAALSAGGAAQAQQRFRFDTTPGHLSKWVVPSHVALTLDLDPARDSFGGQVRVRLKVRRPVPAIELHANELTADTARLLSAGKARGLRVTPLPATQTWRLEPADGRPIAPGRYQVDIRYRGQVNVAGEGLFGAPHVADGQVQGMLATQLEAIHARRVFPAFDEPSFRSVFEIAVRAPSGLEVASNMAHTGRSEQGSTTLHRFAPTPPMPSYLVSVAVGRFDVLQGRAAGVPLRILTAKGKREQARYAMQVTSQLLPFYTRYFGLPYALPKLDQLAVPSVRWGAMEDWGLISYAENLLLVDAQRSGPRTVQNVFATIAHELAHQWFGNLVTAASWEEIWLNEAFATWMERKATGHFNPDWKLPLQTRRSIDRAMAIDAGAATRAIRSGPVSESAVFDVFDPITYAKGGAVLTMLEQWTGANAFRRGLASYMKERRLSNATAADLWHHIGRASGRDIASVAASWTDQQGLPLVQLRSACIGGRQQVALSQRRFLSLGAGQASPQVWKIPLRLSHGAQVRTLLFDRPEHTVVLGACSPQPVLAQAGGAGFYRLAYDSDSLRALTAGFAALRDTDRATLLSDSFALMQAGQLPMQAYLDLLQALPTVTDASRTMLWSLARTQLAFLDTALAGTAAQARLRALAVGLLAPQLDRLGWAPAAGEDPQTAEWRGGLIELLARFDHAPTVAQAAWAFDDDSAGTQALPAALREPVTLAVGMHADAARFAQLLALLKAARGEEERWLYASALASGRDATRAGQLLDSAHAGLAPPNVSASLPGLVARLSPFGEEAYRHTLVHWQALAAMAGRWDSMKLLPQAASGFHGAEQAARLVEDQKRLAGSAGAAHAAREAEGILLRAAVRQRAADTPALGTGH